MRLSKAFIPTLKEVPADAVVISHKLMLRAGMVRSLMAGVYSYLPFGQRAALKATNIIREEMDRIGGQELLMPALNPAEIWQETKRYEDFGPELFRLKDRKNRELVLAPTHEEIICSIARGEVRSYKQLPQIWYQIQTKFRDEPRPRSGELRTRQFVMKDAYSLDVDQAGLDVSYQKHDEAYRRIFRRAGLDFFVVGASSGLMGGTGSEEFMVASDAGEDTCAVCDDCDYAANVEVATSGVIEASSSEKIQPLTKVYTPEQRTVEEVAAILKLTPGQFIKSLIFMGDRGLAMVLVRGDDEVNESKLLRLLGASMRPAHPDEVKDAIGAEIGFLGPVGLEGKLPIYADLHLRKARNMATGANENHYHITGVQVDESFKPDEYHDLRIVREGEPCPNCGSPLHVFKAIELGHIFKLGTKYSSAMGTTVLNADGKDVPVVMGSYGIGVGRMIASVIESHADRSGIVWPISLAPYEVVVIALNVNDQKTLSTAENLFENLKKDGYDAALDDRDERPGFKFKDADLLGFPFQVVVSERNLDEGKLEIKNRRNGEKQVVPEKDALATLKRWYDEAWAEVSPEPKA
ncbi:MAG: proline--tRNA ligase [bacterium]